MFEENRNSLSYKIQKNPFLLGLGIIVVAVVLVGVFSLGSAISEKKQSLEATTAPATESLNTGLTEARPEDDKIITLEGMERYSESIKTVSATKENNCVRITVEYTDKKSLLDVHYAANVMSLDVYPVFYFYINNGTQVGLPAELKLKGDTIAQYSLYNIEDLVNTVALTDKITVNYENVLNALKFNLYIKHKNGDGVGRTILGTYAMNYEDFTSKYPLTPVMYSDAAQGIKSVEMVKEDEFVWLDIYFTDEAAYKKLNNNFENNFLCFGFEKGGKKQDWNFITTEYDDIYMLRCKFDSYSMKQLLEEIGETGLTIPELFGFRINVWTSNYDTETPLFTMG